MNIQTFFDNFDTIAEAPGGIPKLRSLILDLAVQGKLVPQNPEDEPANEIVKQVQEIRKAKKIPQKKIEKLETPDDWELSAGWVWTCLQELGEINPKNDLPDELTVGFVPMTLVPTDYRQSVEYEKRQWSEIKKGFTHFANGDVGVAKITPCFQNKKSVVFSNLPNNYGSGTTEILIFRPLSSAINPKYVLLFLKTPYFIDNGVARMTGTAGQQRVPRDYFAGCAFPLPPLAEQKRIVEKVDELMGLCDRLSSAKQARDNLRQKLRESAIASLMNAETDKELDTAWAFVRNNWHNLSQYPEDVEGLRKIVLELAMRGKLTSQQEEDEPSHILLEQIKHKKEALDSKGKKDRKYKGLIVNSKSYKIPKNWKWVRWIDVGFCQNGKAFPSNDYSDRGIKLLRPGNLHVSGKIQWTQSNTKYLSTSYIEKYPEFIVGSNELIMNLTAQSLKDEFLGRVCLTDESEHCLLNQRLARIIPVGFLSEFCLILFKSPLFRQFVDELNQGTLIQHMYTSQLNDFKFPLPPLAEQKRIVAKVDELMQLCDKLEASLRQSQQRAESLAASAISHLTI